MTFPTIVLPGFATSTLVDLAMLPPKNIWQPLDFIRPPGKKMRAILPYPRHPRYSVAAQARIRAGFPFTALYKKLLHVLRVQLRGAAHDPLVYPFAYDWRLPLELIEEELDRFIGEVIGRARLMARSSPAATLEPKVNLIGHSMGGLVAAGYLASGRTGSTHLRYCQNVNRLITIGTPYAGSTAIVHQMIHGLHRASLRLIPSTYYLLPTADISVLDLFDERNWPATLRASLANYAAQTKMQLDLLAEFLAAARAYRDKLRALAHSQTPWLIVAGMGQSTLAEIGSSMAAGRFVFTAPSRQGDGYVLDVSARPAWLGANQHRSSVWLNNRDYTTSELGSKALNMLGVVRLHTNLPKMDATHRAIVDFLQ